MLFLHKAGVEEQPSKRSKSNGDTCAVAVMKETKNLGCPGENHKCSPNAPKFEDRSQEATDWQEQWARESSVQAGKENPEVKGETDSFFFSPTGKVVSPFTIQNQTRGKIICGGLRSVDAHD